MDAIIKRGECDFVAEVAGEMPSFVIAQLMGLPLDDGRKLHALTEIIHSTRESLLRGNLDTFLPTVREVFTRMHDIALLEAPGWLPSNFIAGPKRMPVRFSAHQP